MSIDYYWALLDEFQWKHFYFLDKKIKVIITSADDNALQCLSIKLPFSSFVNSINGFLDKNWK